MRLPTRRTLLKFGRGMLFAGIAAALSFALDNAASLDLGETGTLVLLPIIGFAYRWARGQAGKEPVA
jgi:hypothetical protein